MPIKDKTSNFNVFQSQSLPAKNIFVRFYLSVIYSEKIRDLFIVLNTKCLIVPNTFSDYIYTCVHTYCIRYTCMSTHTFFYLLAPNSFSSYTKDWLSVMPHRLWVCQRYLKINRSCSNMSELQFLVSNSSSLY